MQPGAGPDLFAAIDLWIRARHPRMCAWMRRRALRGTDFPSIALPRTGNAKFAWRKVFDRDPRFTPLSDKLAVREIVRDLRPDLAAPEVLWVGRHPRDIPDAALSGDVVVKTNHASAANVFVRGGVVDRPALERRMRRSLRRGYGRQTLEWGYFGVDRKVFVERLIPGGDDLHEFKFYTYGRRIERLLRAWGQPGAREAQLREPDADGILRFVQTPTPAVQNPNPVPVPPNWDRLVAIARDLGAPFDHMRVDLLSDGGTIWFSELTIYTWGGRETVAGNDPDAQISRAWDLRRSWFLTTPQAGWRARYAKALRRALDADAAAAPPLPPA